jgi:hypothetical protein
MSQAEIIGLVIVVVLALLNIVLWIREKIY